MFSSASKPKVASNSNDQNRRRSTANEPQLEAPSTPSLRDMISRAVADLREAHGSTAKSIFDYVSTKFSATPTKINYELQKSVEAGVLIADPSFSGKQHTSKHY